MKAIVNNENIAFYLFDDNQDFDLKDDALLIGNKIDINVTSQTHKVVEVTPFDGVFVGGALSVNNDELVISNPTLYDAISADITAELLRVEEERSYEAHQELIRVINEECQNRIFAVVSPNTQMNIAAHAAAGLLTPEQDAVFKAGLQWIADMVDVARQLIANKVEDYRSDNYWPAPSQEMINLAEQF